MSDRDRDEIVDDPPVDLRAVVGTKVRASCPDCGQEVVTEIVAVDLWPETIAHPATIAPVILWPDGRHRWLRLEDIEVIE